MFILKDVKIDKLEVTQTLICIYSKIYGMYKNNFKYIYMLYDNNTAS